MDMCTLVFLPNTPFHTLVQVIQQLFSRHIQHTVTLRTRPLDRDSRTDQVRVTVDRRVLDLAPHRPEPHPRRDLHTTSLEVLQRRQVVRHAQARRVIVFVHSLLLQRSPFQGLDRVFVPFFVLPDCLDQFIT